MSNKHKHKQAVPLAFILIVITIVGCGAGVLIKGLLLKHQIDAGGTHLKKLERDLHEITIKIKELQTRKDKLTSVTALQAAVDKGVVKLVKIPEESVLVVGQPRVKPHQQMASTAGVQPVVLRNASKKEDR